MRFFFKKKKPKSKICHLSNIFSKSGPPSYRLLVPFKIFFSPGPNQTADGSVGTYELLPVARIGKMAIILQAAI